MEQSGNLNASIESVTGSIYHMTVKYDNGYAVKINGELRPGAKFIAYKKSIKKWEAPHDTKVMTPEMVAKVVADVEKGNGPDKVNILFE